MIQRIGRPGVPNKLQIPDGFRLFEISLKATKSFGALRYFVDDRTDFGALLVTNGNQSAGDIKIVCNPLTWTEATTAWSSGTEYQIEVELPAPGFRYTPEEVITTETVIESPNCDNQERTTLTTPKVITEFTGLTGSRPQIGMKLSYLNTPTSRNLCYRDIDFAGEPVKVLIRNSIISSIRYDYSMLQMVEKDKF